MKTPARKIGEFPDDNTGNQRPPRKVDAALIDPATNRPVVRDLRYHKFVAHQRDFYFLNHRDSQ